MHVLFFNQILNYLTLLEILKVGRIYKVTKVNRVGTNTLVLNHHLRKKNNVITLGKLNSRELCNMITCVAKRKSFGKKNSSQFRFCKLRGETVTHAFYKYNIAVHNVLSLIVLSYTIITSFTKNYPVLAP